MGYAQSKYEDGVEVGEDSHRWSQFIGRDGYHIGMPKIEPALTTLTYVIPDGTSYVDLAKDLSKVNRRLYRQGMTYAVQSINILLADGMQASDIYRLGVYTTGNTWVVQNAWKKGFAAWRNQVREVTQATGIRAGAWNDFKVYLDDTMEDGTTLEPLAGDGAVYQAGEWDYSALVFDDDGTEKDLKMHLIGSSNLADTNEESGIGLIHEYGSSRVTVPLTDPNVPAGASDSIYAKLFGTDEMTDRVVDNVEFANDSPPYDMDDYPGGAANADAANAQYFITCNATNSSVFGPGFIAPCGLIKFVSAEQQLDGATPAVYETTSAPNTFCIVSLVPGPYRGVLAAPMGQ